MSKSKNNVIDIFQNDKKLRKQIMSIKRATLKIFNVKNGTTIYIDDISFRRSVSEMPVSDNLSTGWYPNNATSSIAASTGVHTLNMDNNNPQLKRVEPTTLLGARIGKIKDGKVQAIPGHNIPLATAVLIEIAFS